MTKIHVSNAWTFNYFLLFARYQIFVAGFSSSDKQDSLYLNSHAEKQTSLYKAMFLAYQVTKTGKKPTDLSYCGC